MEVVSLDTERMVKAIVAISCLTVLEMTALIMGVDGAVFSVVIAAIAGLGGYTIGKVKGNNAKKEEE